MSNIKPYPTRELPRKGKLWRIDWIGQFNLNPLARSEPTIQLVVTPYLGEEINPDNLTYKASYDYEKTRVVELGIGQLPPLTIGSFVRDKKVVATPDYTTRTFDLNFGGATTQLVRADAEYHVRGRSYRYIPQSYYPLPAGMEATMILVVERQVTDDSDVSKVLFPCGELVRFYFGTSTSLLKEVVKGGLDIGANTIYNPELTGWRQDGSAQVQLRRGIKDEDAPVAARIGLSTYAQCVTRHIHASIERNSANGLGYIPEVLPPFYGHSTMRLHGKLVKSGRYWHLLVFWIESCSAPFPFEQLWWARDNDGRKRGPDDPDRPEAWKDTTKAVRHTPEDEADEPEVRSDAEPSLDREKTEVRLNSPRFTDLLNKEIEKDEKLDNHYRSARPPKFVTEGQVEGFGTADGTFGDTPLDRLEIFTDLRGGEPARAPRARRSKLPANLDTFMNVLNALKHPPAVTYRLVPVPPEEAMSNGNVSYFPRWKGKRVIKWSFISYPERRREVIVAELNFHGHYFYFLESERRPDVEGQTKERYATLVLHRPGGVRIEDHQLLQRILLHGAKNGGVWVKKQKWPFGDLVYERLAHQPGTVERFAGVFLRYLRTVVPEAPEDAASESAAPEATTA